MREKFRKFCKTYLIVFIFSLAFGTLIFSLFYFNNDKTLYSAMNGTSVAAVALICVGGLMFVASEGFFDIFKFGFKQAGSSMFSKKANENNDYATYMDESKAKRIGKPKVFWSVLLAGVLFLIAFIILRIL